MEQRTILNTIRDFYVNLFSSQDNYTHNCEIEKVFEEFSKYNKNFKIDDTTLGKYLSVTEVSQALKSMKNNKTPGTDGISVDFFESF